MSSQNDVTDTSNEYPVELTDVKTARHMCRGFLITDIYSSFATEL